MTESFELPSGLPEGPWEWEIHDHSLATLYRKSEGPDFGHILSLGPCEACAKSQSEWKWRACRTPPEAVARAIAAIPDMVREIERLRQQLEFVKSEFFKSAIIEGLHARNAELREVLRRVVEADDASIAELEAMNFGFKRSDENSRITELCRAVLAKTESAP